LAIGRALYKESPGRVRVSGITSLYSEASFSNSKIGRSILRKRKIPKVKFTNLLDGLRVSQHAYKMGIGVVSVEGHRL
jgi:hypothetical protein